jgi:AcrR family transcriptional regulator
MSSDDRRRAIVEAIIPLLIEQGANVTTRQIAEAAGIAEGTIFRVFPDKCALINEAIKEGMDPAPVQRDIAAIDPEATFEEQLRQAVRILMDRLDEVIALMTVLRTIPMTGAEHRPGPPAFVLESQAAIAESLTDLLARNRERLRLEPARAAMVLRGLVFATGHPGAGEKLTADDIVDVMLGGVAGRPVEVVH